MFSGFAPQLSTAASSARSCSCRGLALLGVAFGQSSGRSRRTSPPPAGTPALRSRRPCLAVGAGSDLVALVLASRFGVVAEVRICCRGRSGPGALAINKEPRTGIEGSWWTAPMTTTHTVSREAGIQTRSACASVANASQSGPRLRGDDALWSYRASGSPRAPPGEFRPEISRSEAAGLAIIGKHAAVDPTRAPRQPADGGRSTMSLHTAAVGE